jgi:hypothetical protein
MTDPGDRRIAFIFGILGAALLGVEALVALIEGVVYFAIRHVPHGFGSLEQAVLLLVMALLVGFFASVGSLRGGDRTLAAGVVLIVLAVVGWAVLGFGGAVLSLVGSILVLISGIVFLVASR